MSDGIDNQVKRKSELIQLAKAYNIKGRSLMTKEQLFNKIQEYTELLKIGKAGQ